jgi:alkanesulfonate monooxygenase SsuD/methylene tetrahydromethanopterin reductase-like flavin-dependent oxidoreductase (luciferase family)
VLAARGGTPHRRASYERCYRRPIVPSTQPALAQNPYPPLYFGDSSDAGQDVAAEHCDVYLTWGERPAEVGEKLAEAQRRAAERGRTLSFGIRLHIVVRETAEEAWRDADALIKYVDDAAIAFSQRTFARFDSVGQQRMTRLHSGRREKLARLRGFGPGKSDFGLDRGR